MGVKRDPVTDTWTVSYSMRPPGGGSPISRRRKNISTEKEARRILNELIKELAVSTKRKVLPSWRDLCSEYLENIHLRGYGANTIENTKLCLVAHTFERWGDRTVDEIYPEDIQRLIKVDLAERSVSSQKNILKYIKNVFKFGEEIGVVNKSPAPNMQFRLKRRFKTVLTREQARTLLQKAREFGHEYFFHWFLAIYTGMRNGELYALTWDKVIFEINKIKIDTSWNNKCGFKSTKSGEDRWIEIAPPLLPILLELKANSSDRHFVLPRIGSWDKGRQAEVLRYFLTGINLPQISFHDLRATWATLLLTDGVPPKLVMDAGGWKDLKTMEFYIRKSGVSVDGVMKNFNLDNPKIETEEKE